MHRCCAATTRRRFAVTASSRRLLVRDGSACLVEAHLRRLDALGRMLDLPAPDLPGVAGRDRRGGRAVDGGDGRRATLRLVYTRAANRGPTPTAYVTVAPPGRSNGRRRGATGRRGVPWIGDRPAPVPTRCRGCWPAPRRRR